MTASTVSQLLKYYPFFLIISKLGLLHFVTPDYSGKDIALFFE